MDVINELIDKKIIEKGSVDQELLTKLFCMVRHLKATTEPYISNDPVKHRVNIVLKGRQYPFLVIQDDEYYLRRAAKIINDMNVDG